ncbi:MAG: hypothetical protein HY344_00600 [Candidatus Levybacteria bacterium]|nr:hypothetical protein [Candidatus Levybacteria bacterium]
MAVRNEAIEQSAQAISFPFAHGTRPETARMLIDARESGVLEGLRPAVRELIDRYYGTDASLKDLGVAAGMSTSHIGVRLRQGLEEIRELLGDEVTEKYPKEATLLKLAMPRPPRDLDQVQAPFPISVRLDTPQKETRHKEAMQRVFERPPVYFKSSEYLLRRYVPPKMPDQEPHGELMPMTQRVLTLIGRGLTYAEIAPIVGMSTKMVGFVIGRKVIRPVMQVSNPHEALVVSLTKGLVSLREASKGLNLSDENVDSLSIRAVEVLIADTVDNLGMTRKQIGERIGNTESAIEDLRTRIYQKLGVLSKAQATVFVMAYVKKAMYERRYPIKDTIEGGGSFEDYHAPEAPDIQYTIDYLKNVGISERDKQAFLIHFLWSEGRGTYALIRRHLRLEDRPIIEVLLNRVIDAEVDPRYSIPVLDIYHNIFAPIELARVIFFNNKGERTYERFRALVDICRKRIREEHITGYKPSTRTELNIEAQRLLDQRKAARQEVVVFD